MSTRDVDGFNTTIVRIVACKNLHVNVRMAPLTGSWLMFATRLYLTCTFMHPIPLTPYSQYWPSSGLAGRLPWLHRL